MSLGKNIGFITKKVLELTNSAAKKLETYADNSIKENQNKNALKLSSAMKKLSKNIEKNKDRYVETAEKNADIVEKNVKKIYGEMKTRVQAAKEKAQKDIEKKKEATAETNQTPEEETLKAATDETTQTQPEENTPADDAPKKTKKTCKKATNN